MRNGVTLIPEIEGGGQERGLRAGTVNVPGAVALATALRVTHDRRAEEIARITKLRDRLLSGLLDAIPSVIINGDSDLKVAGNCHLGFPGLEAEALLGAGCVRRGSSCSSGATEPSHVLEAMGLSQADALASIRLSLGYASTVSDVNTAVDLIPDAVARLRGMEAA